MRGSVLPAQCQIRSGRGSACSTTTTPSWRSRPSWRIPSALSSRPVRPSGLRPCLTNLILPMVFASTLGQRRRCLKFTWSRALTGLWCIGSRHTEPERRIQDRNHARGAFLYPSALAWLGVRLTYASRSRRYTRCQWSESFSDSLPTRASSRFYCSCAVHRVKPGVLRERAGLPIDEDQP
jgi:hypothetical protein